MNQPRPIFVYYRQFTTIIYMTCLYLDIGTWVVEVECTRPTKRLKNVSIQLEMQNYTVYFDPTISLFLSQ